MVFESIVADLLNRFIGDYVENLDRSQLKIGIWGGDVVLQNLILKQSALDELDLPVKTVYGHLGKLVLKIPWKNLYSAPVEATVERLFLLAIPNQEVSYEAEKEEKYAQDSKQSELQRVEDAKKHEKEQGQEKPPDSFVEKLATQIIKNVQVTIQDIHIRYEDKISVPNCPFSVGITLHNLSVHTTDENWKQCIVKDECPQIHKVLNLEGLAVYWNCRSKPFPLDKPPEILLNEFRKTICSKDQRPEGYLYMLGPINSMAKLRLNPKPESDGSFFKIPKMWLNLELESLAIGISKEQYGTVIGLVEQFGYMIRGAPYRKYRPNVPKIGHAKVWWKFAYRCILEEEILRKRRNWDWNHIYEHRKLLKKYAGAYKAKLSTKKVPQDVLDQCTECEKRLDVLNIVLVRQRVEVEIERLDRELQASKDQQRGWFAGWWGGGTPKPEEEGLSPAAIVKKFEMAMSPEEKAKLYRAIDYQENSAPTQYPKTFNQNVLRFNLKKLTVEVRDDQYDIPRVMYIELAGVTSEIKQRPSAQAMKLVTTVDHFTIYGLKQGTHIPELISSKQLTKGSVLLNVLFETNPIDETCDQRCHVNSRPLQIVYDAQTINKLVDVFQTPQSAALSEVQAVAGTRFTEFRERSATGLQHAIEMHSILDLKIELNSSYVLLPQCGIYMGTEDLLVVNLGNVSMRSIPRDQSQNLNIRELVHMGTSEAEVMKIMASQSYDKFIIELKDMQILTATAKEDWKAAIIGSKATPLHILQPTSLIVNFENCLISDDPRLPKMKIAAHLPNVTVSVIDQRLLNLLNLLNSIPFPSSEEVEINPPLDAGSRASSMSQLSYRPRDSSGVKRTSRDQPIKLKTVDVGGTTNVVQATDLQVNFVMGELKLMVLRQEEKEAFPLLDLGVLRVELDMIQQTFDMTVTARIGGIITVFHDESGVVKLLDTPMAAGSEEYMFVLKYINVNKKSPEFRTKHGSVMQLVLADFTQLTVLLHQEALVLLMEFNSEIRSRLDSLAAKKSGPAPSVPPVPKTTLEPILEEGVTRATTSVKRQVRRGRLSEEVIDFKLKANIHKLDVNMANRRDSLSQLTLEGVTVGVTVKKSCTDVAAKLKNITIIDSNPKTFHPKIVSVVGQEALSAAVVVYNLTDDSNPDSIDVSVKAQMACIRVVFVNRYVNTILGFLNAFQTAQQMLADAAAGAAEAARQNVHEAYSKATRISLDVAIKAPVIVIPANSRSPDALYLDFGDLSVKNKFDIVMVAEGEGHNPVIDEMQLGLQNLKLSRVTVDKDGDVVNECVMLQPISFILIIRRNLSSSWYKQIADIEMSGRLKTIHIKISHIDYAMALRVASENLTEGGHPTPAAPPHSIVESRPVNWKESTVLQTQRPKSLEVGSGEGKVKESLESTEAVSTSVRFTFTMDSLIIELFSISKKDQNIWSPLHVPENGLARFTMQVLSLKGHLYSDGSMSTALLLVDCLLDDTRPGRVNFTRLMERKAEPADVKDVTAVYLTDSSGAERPFRSMVDITFQMKGDDMFADVRIFSFNLVLSPNFLMKVAAFLTPDTPGQPGEIKPRESSPQRSTVKSKSSRATMKSVHSKPSSQAKPAKPSESRMTINIKVEKPDIILLENMDDLDSNALVLNNEVIFKLRLSENHMVMSGTIKDLQLYACCYSKRKETISQILRPCSISLAGSTPPGEGLHLDVCVSDIKIRVCPAAIELLGRIQAALVPTPEEEDEADKKEDDFSKIWQPSSFSEEELWFLKTEEGEEAIEVIQEEVHEVPTLGEICMISVPSIVVTVEAGVGNSTLPMILLEVGFQGSVNNWSSQLHVESGLSVQMSYYNSSLALWEPLIEPVETIVDGRSTHTPWELTAQIQTNNPETALSPIQSGDDVVEVPVQIPALTIDVSSKENLELTVTKTCLEVLMNLGNAFQDAYMKGIPPQIESVAPYTVQNDTGMAVALLLAESPFRVHNKTLDISEYKEVMLENGATVGLCLEDETFDTFMQSTSTCNLEQVRERFLGVKVIERNCKLILPVTRADKRYFSLQHRGDNNDMWGLVSDVKVQDGGTIITLRSIIQVCNNFTVPIDVYYMTKRGNEVEHIGTVGPKERLNLPLYAVYTPTNELFFSVEGYTVSVVPFVWKELQNMLSTTKILQCEPKDKQRKEPFFMKIVGELEQVYFENTNRHTMVSSCYNIHLRPAVMIRNFLPVDVICCLAGTAIEAEVKAGERIHMPTAEPGACSIVFRIPDYLEKEWSCKSELQAEPPEFAVWTFESYDSAQRVSMDLGLHTTYKSGSLLLSLYCPFWMLNKTGLMLSYRKSQKTEKKEAAGSPMKQSDDTANILYHPDDFKGPILFSFKAKSFFGKKKASVKIEDGEWSDKFSLDAAGSSGVIDCMFDGMLYKVGISIQLTYSTLTKQVTFTPYYVLINNSQYPIECQEAARPADPWVKVQPESCAAFWPKDADIRHLRARIVGSKETTAPFSYNNVYTTLLRLDNKYGGISVDIQMTEGAVYISFMSYGPGLAPAFIVNHTPVPIPFSEKGCDGSWALDPYQCVMFTWSDPLGPRELVWSTSKKKEESDDLRKDGIGEFSPDSVTPMYWVSFLDGMQRVLLFTSDPAVARDAQSAGELEAVEQEINVSIHGVGLSLVNNIAGYELLYIGIASSGIVWEARKANNKRFKSLGMNSSQLIEKAYQYYNNELQMGKGPDPKVMIDPKTEVDFELGQMTRPNKRHLRRVFQTGLWLQMRTSAHQLQLHAKVNRLQIDNQMYDCLFPVILAPVPPPKSVVTDNAWKPFAEVSVVRRLMEHSPVKQFKYFKVLIQEFHIKIDIGFINGLVEMFQEEELSVQQEAEKFAEDRKLVDQPLLAQVATRSSQEQKHFYDLLHFSPLKIHLSFSLSGGGGQGLASGQESIPPFIAVVLQGLGVTLTDMQDVVFKLGFFERQYTFLTQPQLIYEATMHYVGQSVKQLYVLVLGLDVLGNPYGLVLGFTQGVEDLFYEPFQGAIQGPGEFAEGLVLGVRSLFGHTVGGAAGAVSRITGAMGKGLAALTFDKEYQRKRREAAMTRPANVQMGLAQSGKGLVMGVVDGVSGVFTKPITGAREEGVEGFFKGVGKGVVGLVARPTAGVIDFASGSLEAVKRATELNDEVTRLRPPRFLQQDGLVRPYTRKNAEGAKLLKEVEKGRYATTDVYAYHEPILYSNKEMLLLTDKRVMYIIHNDIFGGWQVEWEYTWDAITMPPSIVEKGVFISVGEPRKKVLGLFGSDKGGKLILIKENAQKQLIASKMQELMASS